MKKTLLVVTAGIMFFGLVVTFPLYLWATFVQRRLGNSVVGVSVYLAGIILPVVLFYVML